MGLAREAWRSLRRTPTFTLLAVLTLGIGLGANMTIFSIVDSVLLRPLGYAAPQELYAIREVIPQVSHLYPTLPVNDRSFLAWRAESHSLQGLALIHPTTLDLTVASEPQPVVADQVSANLFALLGIKPRLGRDFFASEDAPGRNHVVILTDAFWRREFGASPSALGRTLNLNGQLCQIIGILPRDFHFPRGADFGPLTAVAAASGAPELFQPFGLDPTGQEIIGNFDFGVIARLRPGVTAASAQTEINLITARLVATAHQADAQVLTTFVPLRDQITAGVAHQLWLLLAAVLVIQFLVCLNLANLLLVRVSRRGHEAALRLALGAGRPRLVGAIFAEGLILAAAGCLLGVSMAYAGVRWLSHAAPAGIPRLEAASLEPRAIAFGLLLALAVAGAFSLWPAWRWSQNQPQAALRAGGRAAGGSAPNRGRWLLIAVESALTAMLLIMAGLLLHSFVRLNQVNVGFDPSPKLIVAAQLSGPDTARRALWDQLPPRLRALPGVNAAALTTEVPLLGTGVTDVVYLDGDTRPLSQRPIANYQYISPDYFSAMGIALLSGRDFTASDAPPHCDVAILSATAAARVFVGRNPVGRQFRYTPDGPPITVVGVAADVRTNLQASPGLVVYQPYWDNLHRHLAYIVLRTATASPLVLASPVRRLIAALAPAATVPKIETMRSVRADSVATQQFQLWLVLLFALCALGLASLGIYAVVAYAVGGRTQELGIRLALGANRGALAGMVFRQGMRPVLGGLSVGALGALLLGRGLASQLFATSPHDPLAFVLALGALLAASAAACALPARRALAGDPISALRCE
ncbi:MAG TPA: ADOP family duplicated permease [Terriglobales bacterium]|nr:ADOP family duplicated permease [Terriglobales bacterium]